MVKTIPNHVYESLPEWLTLREAAKVLHVTHCTIHAGLHRYGLPMEKRACRNAPPATILRKETLLELVRLRNQTATEKLLAYDDSDKGLRSYHGNSSTTDQQWRCMLLSDKYLRKPIVTKPKAKIVSMLEWIKHRRAA